jgi:hypothetical protein
VTKVDSIGLLLAAVATGACAMPWKLPAPLAALRLFGTDRAADWSVPVGTPTDAAAGATEHGQRDTGDGEHEADGVQGRNTDHEADNDQNDA